ncbi:nuclear transport factor 2 family protein [Methylosinus sp. Sm6]|uniref:nuclear transport factor 2 family protein n=1 Tax=Methylosinus sp. Sm6 TaxID=2866948 RepID=UPI001C98EF70|nr:nuclear transport factor 2 family protein [Methylosinus sp. Sm6]MBY6241326.1 ester cyclase [Methylosinus sp. Sm6]
MSDFDDLFAARPPGLDRAEIVRRARLLACWRPDTPADFALLRGLYSPDVACEFVGDKSRIPYAGRHIGIEALIGIVRAINIEFEQSNHEVEDIIVDGGRVAMRRRVEWRHRGTGRRGCVDLADFARFENGRIVEMIEFRDTMAILAMQDESSWP